MVIEFGGPQKGVVLRLAVTGQCNEYGASSAWVGSQARRTLVAIYIGQAEVEDEDLSQTVLTYVSTRWQPSTTTPSLPTVSSLKPRIAPASGLSSTSSTHNVLLTELSSDSFCA